MTSLEEPRLDRPAVSANGTVRPSAKPMIMSRIMSAASEWLSPARWVLSNELEESCPFSAEERGGEAIALGMVCLGVWCWSRVRSMLHTYNSWPEQFKPSGSP